MVRLLRVRPSMVRLLRPLSSAETVPEDEESKE